MCSAYLRTTPPVVVGGGPGHTRLDSTLWLASSKARKIQDWQDIERADKMARRAAGLDDVSEAKVNVNLQLV